MPEDIVIETPVIETPVIESPEGVTTPETPVVSDTTPPGEVKPVTDIPPEKPADSEKKGQARFDRKISRLYREAAEQKARADLLERQLKEAAPKAPDSGEPKADQFEDAKEYAEALAKHRETKAVQEYEGNLRSQVQQAARQQLQASWEAKVASAEAKYEDFDEVVGDLKPTTAWAVAIMKAENGADVAHFLGTNLKEAQRIMALDTMDQFIAIGKLSAKLEAAPIKSKTPSSAPAPIKPVGGSSSTGTKKLFDMTQDEFDKARRAYIAARR